MSGRVKRPVVRPAPAGYWAVEDRCTLVVNETTREVFRLSGLEQVLWDCLEMGYPPEQVRQAVSALGKLEQDAAEREIQAILEEWRMLGLVELEECLHG